ncbi:MAG: DNA polymerase III subunit delta [Anaerolineae bacterium]|jgi:DNA polymerase-3 subunit delta|nr:DNA polymerase III subunit delta [Chloroflexota bacterium]
MFYIFHGDDEFTRSEEIARFRARIQEDGMGEINISTYDGKTIALAELLSACNTLPFFSDKRMVMVTDMLQRYEGRANKRLADEAEALAQFLPHLPESTRLVFVESIRLAHDNPVLRKVRDYSNAYIHEFAALRPNRPEEARQLQQWITARARAKGLAIEPAATARLIEAAGGDLRRLDAELDKLGAYADYARDIRADDVLSLVTPDPETPIYQLLDHLCQRRRGDALHSLHNVLASDPRSANGIYPLAAIAGRLSQLLATKDLLERQRLALPQAAKALKVADWQIRRLSSQAALFSSDELVRLLDQAMEIDRGLKTGDADPLLSLEMLVIEATRRTSRPAPAQRPR